MEGPLGPVFTVIGLEGKYVAVHDPFIFSVHFPPVPRCSRSPVEKYATSFRNWWRSLDSGRWHFLYTGQLLEGVGSPRNLLTLVITTSNTL